MIEIILQNGETLIVENNLDFMATILADAKKQKIMLNVFDTFSKRRYLFFPEAVVYIKEKID